VIHKKFKLALILVAVFCFLINFLFGNTLYISIFNSLFLVSSLAFVYLAEDNMAKTPLILVMSFSLIPMFSLTPGKPILYLFVLLAILFWLVALKVRRGKHLFVSLGLLICFWGSDVY